MTRRETLQSAEKCVCGEREEDYGSPENNFSVIAGLWEVYLRAKCVGANADVCVCAEDVAIMQALLKIGRISGGQVKGDNYIDLAGYSACAAEIVTTIKPEPEPAPDVWTEEDELKRVSMCKLTRCVGCGLSVRNRSQLCICLDYANQFPAEARRLIAEMEAERNG